MENQRTFVAQYTENVVVNTSAQKLFAFLDDHRRLSGHMSSSSWMMGGGRMEVVVDEGRGQKVGSHIRLFGKAFGINLSLDEVITQYEPPFNKEWETVGKPKILVIGSYRMGMHIREVQNQTILRIFINYDMPSTNAWIGRLLGGFYAKWCVRQMLRDAQEHFKQI